MDKQAGGAECFSSRIAVECMQRIVGTIPMMYMHAEPCTDAISDGGCSHCTYFIPTKASMFMVLLTLMTAVHWRNAVILQRLTSLYLCKTWRVVDHPTCMAFVMPYKAAAMRQLV